MQFKDECLPWKFYGGTVYRTTSQSRGSVCLSFSRDFKPFVLPLSHLVVLALSHLVVLPLFHLVHFSGSHEN